MAMWQSIILSMQEGQTELTDEQNKKLHEWASQQAAIEQRYMATLDTLKDIEGVDLKSLFVDVLPPEWLQLFLRPGRMAGILVAGQTSVEIVKYFGRFLVKI